MPSYQPVPVMRFTSPPNRGTKGACPNRARVPRPRATSRGAALVQFSLTDGEQFASVAIARSLGSARLDRAALPAVQHAAPFPAPPAGAQRSFSVKIEARWVDIRSPGIERMRTDRCAAETYIFQEIDCSPSYELKNL